MEKRGCFFKETLRLFQSRVPCVVIVFSVSLACLMGMNLNVSFEEVWIKEVRRKLIEVKFIHKSTKLKMIGIIKFKSIQGVE